MAVRNERLRRAIKTAGLTIGGLAKHMGVDRKTAERWIAGRVPYDYNRSQIAQLLNTTPGHLWPDQPDSTTPTGSEVSPTAEVEAIWPTRADVPTERWRELITRASEAVDIAAYSAAWLFDADPGFAGHLADAADRGAHVRVAMSRPTSARALVRGKSEGIGNGIRQMAKLAWTYLDRSDRIAASTVELRDHDLDLPATMIRADDRLMWSPLHAGLGDRLSPVLMIRLDAGGAIGANALVSLDWVWARSGQRAEAA